MSERSYRESHASPGYGQQYSDVYKKGYYRHQWEELERPLLRKILDELKLGGSESVLDFACGTGRILSESEKVFGDAMGVDVSETMLDVARGQVKRATLLCQDITQHPLERSFDVATAFRFFVNAEPSLRSAALASLYGTLNDGGVLVANIHQNSCSPLGLAYRGRNKLKGRPVANVLSHSEFTDLLKTAGFEVVDTHWYSFLPRVGWFFSETSGKLLSPFEKICKALKVPPSMCQSFVVCARKT